MACSQFAIPGWASHQPSALDREPLIHTIQSILVVYRRRRRLAIVMATRRLTAKNPPKSEMQRWIVEPTPLPLRSSRP